jgi:hypothetical protein
MSGISGIAGSNSQDMYILLQQISRTQSATAANAATTSTSAASSTGSSGSTNTLESLRKAIEEAVAQALADLDENSSAETVMKTVKSAVDGALKAAGIEPPPPPPDGVRPPGGPGGAAGAGDDFVSMLDQLLEENGFDPEKIKEELRSQRADTQQTPGTASFTLNLLMYLPATGGVDTQA